VLDSIAGVSGQIAELYGDTQRCALAAGLVYVSGDEPGIRRRRHGRGFGYRSLDDTPLTDTAAKERILALAIPPAWRNVWICPDDNGHILAVGEDERGRKQYIYHHRWRALRDLLNFYRLIAFGEHLPQVRAHVDAQLRRRTLDHDRVLSAMVRIIDTCAIRIGNEVYAEENDSFGLSTLTRKHVRVDGDAVMMAFRAKSGKHAELVVHDRQVAKVVEALSRQRRTRLFTVDGVAIDSAQVNELLIRLTGEHITAKDFRTWRGTLTAFAYLDAHLDSDRDHERLVIEAADAAADALGNTRTVARAHYIHPQVLSTFLDGSFADLVNRSRPSAQPGLTGPEERMLAFLSTTLEAETELGVAARASGS
jgi:DNA topoisomerase-1